MYYEPKYFTPPEFFSRDIFNRERDKGNQIWRLMDSRILWTADKIRERFCGIRKNSQMGMIINTWTWNGDLQYRGYRDIYVDILYPDNKFSVTSQHVFGRAMDYDIEGVPAEEIVQDIKDNPNAEAYKYITGLEEGTTWVHNDTRSWKKASNGLFIFQR